MRKRSHSWSFERILFYGYFLVLIGLGSAILSLPASWSGPGSIAFVDALFTAVSAVCVTGLITIDTALWSGLGKGVILALIQAGGLGIVTFGTLYLFIPGARISLRSTKFLRSVFVSEQMPRVRQMITAIVCTTVLFETAGAVLLSIAFTRAGTESPVFEGIFHAVSAFCNAGFSLYSDGLVPFRSNVLVNVTIIILIVCGGMGFMVIRDVRQRLFAGKRSLQYHSRVVLTATALFILAGFAVYMIFDSSRVFTSTQPAKRVMVAFFQSVTTRTAGFNTVNQSELSTPSLWITLIFMLVGGAPGSTAGGIKVTTAFILLVALVKGVKEQGNIDLWKRQISSDLVGRSAMFFFKAIALLLICALTLGLIENLHGEKFSNLELVFESVSALGTVGLSLGITSELSLAGKLVVAATMFAGRVGLFSMVIRTISDRAEKLISYPTGEVLIG